MKKLEKLENLVSIWVYECDIHGKDKRRPKNLPLLVIKEMHRVYTTLKRGEKSIFSCIGFSAVS